MKFLVAIALALVFAVHANAQTVGIVSTQDTSPGIGTTGFGAKLTAVACNAAAAARWTGWINVSSKRNIVFDIDYVDADASGAKTVRCEASRVSTTVADAGYDLPVITSTAATGINSTTINSWQFFTTAGGTPGTTSWVLYIENIPAPFIECLFDCGGAAADNVTVFARGVNP